MGPRIFGPDRLRLLRLDLARSVANAWQEHDDELARLKREREHIDRSLYRQTLRLEEHDDPHHPVAAAAKERIDELTSRRAAIDEAMRALEARRRDSGHPAEIEAMLDAVPDLRAELRKAPPSELADILEAFDVTVVYDKPNRELKLAATVTPELVPEKEKPRPPKGPAGELVYSGGGT